MDNITLSLKDADFIANVIREQIKNLNDAYEEAMDYGNKTADKVIDVARKIGAGDPEIEAKIKELEDTRRASALNIENMYQDKIQIYEKVLMLVMAGSTD